MALGIVDNITFFVAYKTGAWSRGCIDTYRQQFPNEHLLIVDNNEPGYVEGSLLAKEPDVTIITGKGNRHGDGMDTALRWCREQDIPIMVHIEPDMLFLDRRWKFDLLEAMQKGSEMVACARKSYGPFHPTPSAWDTTVEWGTFNARRKTLREKYSVEYKHLVKMGDEPRWFYKNWDTAQGNWFHAARRSKASLLDEQKIMGSQLYHFWCGSSSHPNNEYVQVLQKALRI